MRWNACALAVAVCAALVAPAVAFDVGDPLYKNELGDNIRVELLLASFERDVVITDFGVTAVGPGGTVEREPVEIDTEIESDSVVGRLTWLACEWGAVFADVGTFDDDEADDQPILVGGGVRARVYEFGMAGIHLLATVHAVPEYDVSFTESDPELGREEFEGSNEFFEYSAGAMLSAGVDVSRTSRLVPHAGILYSAMSGDVELTGTFPDVDVVSTGSGDLEEDDSVVGVAGATLEAEHFTVRVQALIGGESSYSGALGASF